MIVEYYQSNGLVWNWSDWERLHVAAEWGNEVTADVLRLAD